MTKPVPEHHSAQTRLEWLDALRGTALIAMAVYHASWDLHAEGVSAVDPVNDPLFKWSARIIAAVFLLLSGISLTLAHRQAVDWPRFWKREAQLVAAAIAVSAGSFVLFPQSWIAFGILHHMAVAGLLGLAFLHRPTPLLLLAALLCLALPQLAKTDLLQGRWVEWIGLSEHITPANDYVPLLPWFAFVLLGMGMGRWIRAITVPAIRWPRALKWLGRHGLVFYLVHQPVLIGLISGLLALGVLEPVTTTPQQFMQACERDCGVENPDAKACKRMCGCLYQELKDLPMMTRKSTAGLSEEEEERIRASVRLCR